MEHIVSRLGATVRRNEGKIAIVSQGRSLSYGDLRRAVAAVADGLASCGVSPGERVTLYAPNCWEWVAAYYGILWAGCVVNPVNALLTAEEVRYIVRDCRARAIIGTREKLEPLVPLLAEEEVRALVCFGEDVPAGMVSFAEWLRRPAGRSSPAQWDLEATCTIAYTSGTTGHPKGAMHSERNVLMNALLTGLMQGRGGEDIVVTALPLPHVYGCVVMNSTLLSGGTLVLHSRFEEAAVLESIARYRANRFDGVPTMYYYLLNSPDLGRADLSSLRMCTVGGQTMPASSMAEVEARFGCPLVELWGMTELAGLGTTFAHTGPVKHGSIGVALPYCRAKIVDAQDCTRELPAGEPGELMITGPVVMQGYYNNETAARETVEPDGWLHTGDIARMDEEGFIYVVDRKKDMILTAGYNVYPAEIERVIAAHPDVAMVAVGAVPDAAKGELAKAYIVPRAGVQVTAESILAHCREHLAAYKVPRAVQFVPDLPKTSTGKILRRKLRELDEEAAP